MILPGVGGVAWMGSTGLGGGEVELVVASGRWPGTSGEMAAGLGTRVIGGSWAR